MERVNKVQYLPPGISLDEEKWSSWFDLNVYPHTFSNCWRKKYLVLKFSHHYLKNYPQQSLQLSYQVEIFHHNWRAKPKMFWFCGVFCDRLLWNLFCPGTIFGGLKHFFTLRSKVLPWGFSKFAPVLTYDSLKLVKFAKMPIFMIFMIFTNSEINEIGLEALFFRIFKIPMAKI